MKSFIERNEPLGNNDLLEIRLGSNAGLSTDYIAVVKPLVSIEKIANEIGEEVSFKNNKDKNIDNIYQNAILSLAQKGLLKILRIDALNLKL